MLYPMCFTLWFSQTLLGYSRYTLEGFGHKLVDSWKLIRSWWWSFCTEDPRAAFAYKLMLATLNYSNSIFLLLSYSDFACHSLLVPSAINESQPRTWSQLTTLPTHVLPILDPDIVMGMQGLLGYHLQCTTPLPECADKWAKASRSRT